MTYNVMNIYKEQMAKLQEQNARDRQQLLGLQTYPKDYRIRMEIQRLTDRIFLNTNHLKILRVNILSIKRAQNQLEFDVAEAIESVNIIQDKLQEQLADFTVAKYYKEDYERLEQVKVKLHEQQKKQKWDKL